MARKVVRFTYNGEILIVGRKLRRNKGKGSKYLQQNTVKDGNEVREIAPTEHRKEKVVKLGGTSCFKGAS